MKKVISTLMLFVSLLLLYCIPAHSSMLFGQSGGTTQTLTVTTGTGVVSFSTGTSQVLPGVPNQGWWMNGDAHGAGNPNYVTMDGAFRNFFSFDLSGLSGGITAAVLSINTVDTTFDGLPVTYSLYSVSTPVATLVNTNGTPGVYADLGSGTRYASYGVSVYPATTMDISLNAAALADINSAAGQFFSIGGSLDSAPVPEPSTYILLSIALGAVGFARRKMNKQT
jgi:hypothetical protein